MHMTHKLETIAVIVSLLASLALHGCGDTGVDDPCVTDGTGCGETTSSSTAGTTHATTAGTTEEATTESAVCGNGVVEEGEECDDGNDLPDDGCHLCKVAPECGNGLVETGEECDLGTENSNVGACTFLCKTAVCGDGYVWQGQEGCDDNNTQSGDGCDENCEVEPYCGDSIVNLDEECDEGLENDDSSACTAACKFNVCGDGKLLTGTEVCDDGNVEDGDCCSSTCTPVEISNGAVKDVALGRDHACAIIEGAEKTCARCWGRNREAQLGLGHEDAVGDDELPNEASPLGFGETPIKMAPGFFHSCALLADGSIRCWGSGAFGQLGHGSTESYFTPAGGGPVSVGGPAIDVAAGDGYSCAVLQGGDVRCWGDGQYGSLGYGNTNNIGDNEPPSIVAPVNLGGPAKQIDTGIGARHTCAVLENGDVVCWGEGEDGKLGYGTTTNIGDNESPSAAGPVSLGGPATQVALSVRHTCALLVNGDVRCWGYNEYGNLGYGHTDNIGDDELPSSAGPVDLGGPAIQITAGTYANCALLANGDVTCWGVGLIGYYPPDFVGDDELPSSMGPVDLGGPATQIAAGDGFYCALMESGELRCWGFGAHGKLGQGNTGGDICIDQNMDYHSCEEGPICCISDDLGEMPPPQVFVE